MADQTIDLDTLSPKQLSANHGVAVDLEAVALLATDNTFLSSDRSLLKSILAKTTAMNKTAHRNTRDGIVAVSPSISEAVIVDPATRSVSVAAIDQLPNGDIAVDPEVTIVATIDSAKSKHNNDDMMQTIRAAIDSGLTQYNADHPTKPLATPAAPPLPKGTITL